MRSSSTMMRSFIMLRYLGALFKAKQILRCSLGRPYSVTCCMIDSTNIPFKSLRSKKWEHVCLKNEAPALSSKEYKCLLFWFCFLGKVLSCFKTLETFTVVMNVCNDSVAWWVESRWGAHSAGARVAPQIVILCQEGISLNENLLTVSDRKDLFWIDMLVTN